MSPACHCCEDDDVRPPTLRSPTLLALLNLRPSWKLPGVAKAVTSATTPLPCCGGWCCCDAARQPSPEEGDPEPALSPPGEARGKRGVVAAGACLRGVRVRVAGAAAWLVVVVLPLVVVVPAAVALEVDAYLRERFRARDVEG